jgi:hypothetical protein
VEKQNVFTVTMMTTRNHSTFAGYARRAMSNCTERKQTVDYDSWKLETPEDEHLRKSRGRRGWRDYRDAERCWNCRNDWHPVEGDELCCADCGAYADDQPAERDPDDARDERMDREIDR